MSALSYSDLGAYLMSSTAAPFGFYKCQNSAKPSKKITGFFIRQFLLFIILLPDSLSVLQMGYCCVVVFFSKQDKSTCGSLKKKEMT